MDVIARDVVADALRDEFAAWIAGHPNAAIFDWNVAAENVLRATTNQGAVEALREVERVCAVAGGERSGSPVVAQIIRAARSALRGQ
jgi:hypothetical protein